MSITLYAKSYSTNSKVCMYMHQPYQFVCTVACNRNDNSEDQEIQLFLGQFSAEAANNLP